MYFESEGQQCCCLPWEKTSAFSPSTQDINELFEKPGKALQKSCICSKLCFHRTLITCNSNVFGVSRRIVLLFVLAITVRVTQALYEGGGVEGRFHSTEIVLRLFKMRYSPFSLPSVLSNLRIPGYSFMFSVLFNVVYRLLVRMHQYLDLALVNCEFISPSKIIIAQQSKKKICIRKCF